VGHAGGDEQRTIGAFERGADGLDGALVFSAVLGEFREVVVEGCVDDRIRFFRAGAKTLQVRERAAMHLGACRNECGRAPVRAGEPKYLVASTNQIFDDSRAHPAGGSSDKYAHDSSPNIRCGQCPLSRYRGKVVILY